MVSLTSGSCWDYAGGEGDTSAKKRNHQETYQDSSHQLSIPFGEGTEGIVVGKGFNTFGAFIGVGWREYGWMMGNLGEAIFAGIRRRARVLELPDTLNADSLWCCPPFG